MKWLVRNSPLKQLSTAPPHSAADGVGKGLLSSCSRQETLAVDIPADGSEAVDEELESAPFTLIIHCSVG